MRRLVWWTIALVCCGALVRGAGRLPPVDVLKCCRIGETLATSSAEPHCELAAALLWAPLVYAQMRRTYLPSGTVPPHWTVIEARRPNCAAGESLHAVRNSLAQKNFLLFTNGSLYRIDEKRMFAPGSYCAEARAALVCWRAEVARASPSTVSGEARPRVHIRKCCGAGGAYSEERSTCTAFEDSAERLLSLRPADGVELVFVDGFPVCDGSETSLVMAGSATNATIDATGVITLEGESAHHGAEAYCVERVVERSDAAVFACARPAPPAPPPDLRFTLYPAGLVVSVIFLAATLVAGFLLPSSHHALHWRCQTHYIACLLLGDLLLAITQLAGGAVSGKACVTMAILMHFFFLSAFFWLNTMCFNIWWTFRDFRPTSLEKSQETCRLRAYEVYAWGGPLLLAGVAAVLDHLPADPAYTFLRPQFGVQRCWFYGDMEILTFFFGPIGVLLAVNLVLFASTARQLTCGLWKREDVKSTTERAALGRVCMKLVVVMGVTWVADVVSWAAGGPAYVWYITDLINALQGVFIFIVVGCQPQVWAAVKRIWCIKKFRNKSNNTTGAPLHSSSQGLPSMGDSVTNNTVANTNTSVKIPMETVC